MPALRRSPRSISAARLPVAHVPAQISDLVGLPARKRINSAATSGGNGCTFGVLALLNRAAKVTVGTDEVKSKSAGVRLAKALARNPVVAAVSRSR